MKRILSMILCIALIGTAIVFAEAPETPPEKEPDFAFDVLTGLGLVDAAYLLDGEAAVSRAEFLSIVMDVIQAPIGSAPTYFKDVAAGDKYEKIINQAAQLQYVSGYQSTFRPNDTITALEAATIILNIAGYRSMATYGNGYLGYAQDNKLVSAALPPNTKMTRTHLKDMLYQMLSVRVYEISGSGVNGADHYYEYTGGDKTFLQVFLDMDEIEGVVTANPYTSLHQPAGTGSGMVRIDDMEYPSAFDGVFDYLGYRVKAYIDISDEQDAAVVFALPYRCDTTVIEAERLSEEKSTKTAYYYWKEDGRGGSVGVDLVADVIYNGVAYPDWTPDEIFGCNGTVSFIDNDLDGDADVLRLEHYETIFLSGISEYDKTLLNYYTYDQGLQKLQMDEIETVVITQDGKQIDLDALQNKSILSVRRPKYQTDKLLYIDVSAQTVTGKVQEASDSDDSVVIDGTRYLLSEDYLAAVQAGDYRAKAIPVGCEGVFYLDVFGKIAAFESKTDTAQYGYLKAMQREQGFLGNVYARILNTEEEWGTYQLADELLVNDIKIEAAEIFNQPSVAVDGHLKPQVIEFKINSDGQIRSLNTAQQSDDYSSDAFRVKDVANIIYRSSNNSFDSQIYMDSSTVTFYVPTTNADGMPFTDEEISKLDETYFYAERGGYTDWTAYTIKAYNCDKFGVTKLLYRGGSISSMGEFGVSRFIYLNQSNKLGSDGSSHTSLKGIYGSNLSASIDVADDVVVKDTTGAVIDLQDLQAGAFLKLYFNAENVAHTVEVVFSPDMVGSKSQYTGSLHDNDVTLYGTVTEIDADADTGRLILDDGLSQTKSLKYKISSTSVYIYDAANRGRDMVSSGSLYDIQPGDYIYTKGVQSTFDYIIVFK